MPYSELFKNKTTSNLIKDLLKKQEDKKELNIDLGPKTQNEVLNVLEEGKEKEEDKEIQAAYDMLIAAVKNFFAKTFDREKALKTLRQYSENQNVSKKALEMLDASPFLEQFAKLVLGENTVENFKRDNAYAKKQSPCAARSL